VRNNRDRVGLLPNQFQNNVDLFLRISIVSADHGGFNPILRGKLPDPFLHALKPRDSGSLDHRDDPDFLRLRLVSAALAAWSTYRKRNGKQECQAGNDYALRIWHHILNDSIDTNLLLHAAYTQRCAGDGELVFGLTKLARAFQVGGRASTGKVF